jgi:hypothetical protein
MMEKNIKIKINREGELFIKRGSDLKKMWCPYHGPRTHICADSCPLFGEPQLFGVEIKEVHLSLCRRLFVLKESEFIDERI